MMKKLSAILLTITMLLSLCMLPANVSAEESGTQIMDENFNDGACAIKSVSSGDILTTIADADTGDEAYGKIFKTTSKGDWYIDLGKTFTAEDASVAKISFDVKSPSELGPNVMFYLGDAENADTLAYKQDNTEYKKHTFYFRSNGNLAVNSDVDGYWSTPTGKELTTYTAATWYHIDITVNLYKQTVEVSVNNQALGTAPYGNQGQLKSFNFLAAHTEAVTGKNWQFDNLVVKDETVEVDKTILFSADFEEVESASEAGLTFVYGEANSAVESGYGDEYGNVMRFTATEGTTSRFKVPVNATDPMGKTVSMSFDLYAEEADKIYCMIYLYDTAGTDYKILVRNSNQAAGQTGYFKFLTVGAPWKPIDCVTSPAQSWVHVDGIFEFRDNQTIIKWYFDGEQAGTTYSFGLKDISYIRFNVNKTETGNGSRIYALDNVLMRQYENKEFETKAELTGEGAGTTLTITPKAKLANDFSAQNCTFNVTDAQTGKAVTVASQGYSDGKVVLTLNGLEYNKPYKVSSSDFADLFGQKMQDFEFYANSQYDTDGEVIPAVSAVWLYDYDGNRLSVKDATTEVKELKVIFNTRMMNTAVEDGITFGGLALDGAYSSKDNSYTATWNGYLAPISTYALNITGAKSVLGKTVPDFALDVSTGDGKVSVKDIELLNASGDTAAAADITDDAVLTMKANLLNTTGDTADAVMVYGIYKDSYMTAHDFTNVSVAANSVLPVTFEIPYDDADAKLKLFMWDELGVLNPYFAGFEPTFGE